MVSSSLRHFRGPIRLDVRPLGIGADQNLYEGHQTPFFSRRVSPSGTHKRIKVGSLPPPRS